MDIEYTAPPDDDLPFFDREAELAQLETAWAARGAQLITLWGRRRVGKSSLLSKFAHGKRAVYLYGTRMAEQDILTGLALLAAETFDDPYLRTAPFPSWQAAFDYLAGQARNERLLVIFDEFPYLCEVTPGLDTLTQRWWDSIHRTANLVLVLAGSGFSFMEGLTGMRGPLHGRRTGQVEVHPLDYCDAASFYPHLQPANRVRAYACFGGVPAYLRSWEGRRTLRDMLEATILAPGHFLFREGEELLRTEFHQEALYASILRAIAAGEERPSDIARAVGRHSADEIFDHLKRLQELHFIVRQVPVTELQRPRTQRVLYRLADPYLRFWFRYVAPYQSFLQLGRVAELWAREIEPTLDEFVARSAWEGVCAQYLWRQLSAGQSGLRFAQLGRWWDAQDEIDLVGLWNGKAVLVGECKWSNTQVGEGVLTQLQAKAGKLPLADSPTWLLASRSGFDRRLRERAEHGEVLLLQPDTLFAGR
jgi:AAA+ ATPase superfamily predicted ATPase